MTPGLMASACPTLYEAQAKKIGMNVLGHDQLDPKEADYTTIITKIKGLNPDAVYYGGVAPGRRESGQAGSMTSSRRSSNAAATAWWTVASSRPSASRPSRAGT